MMKQTLKKSIFGFGKAMLCTAALVQAGPVMATSYPEEPIQWVVPYAPGAASDTLARRIAKDLGDELKKSIVVENQPGAGTVNAARKLKRATPNGYNVMNADISTLALNPILMKDPGYSADDFTMVSMLARLPLVLVVRPDLPVANVSELIEYAKANPDKLNYASAGLGSPHHMGMELLMQKTGSSMTHLPFNGASPGLMELLAGRVDLMFGSVGSVVSYLKSGKLKALGISSEENFPGLEGVKPLHELDPRLDDYEMYAWQGLVTPAGLSDEIRDKLNASLKTVLEKPELIEDFTKLGLEAKWSTAEDFKDYVHDQGETWKKLIEEKGLSRN